MGLKTSIFSKNPYVSQIQYSEPLFFIEIQYWAKKTLINQTLINQTACTSKGIKSESQV